MTEEECKHGLNPAWCADCSGRDGGEEADYAKRRAFIDSGGAIAAIYAGKCARCGERFPVGYPITQSAPDDGWIAWCCIERTLSG